jgi:molybdenum cofactor cytidylyltransferase
MGVPKQLLLWNNRPFIVGVIESAISADLSPLYVVLGSRSEIITPFIQKYPISILINPDWEKGLSTSISKAINTLPKNVDGVLFLLSDQPFISPELILKINQQFQITKKSIVAPMVDNKRGNPVLFSRELFDELITIKGDSGGRSLLDRYPVEWVKWNDPSILFDIDSYEDYQNLQKMNQK